MNPDAPVFLPKWVRTPPSVPVKARISKAQLKAMQPAALEEVRRGAIVTIPPFQGIPATLTKYIELRNYIEFVDIEGATALVTGLTPVEQDPAMNYYCVQCSHGPQPCKPISDIITAVRRREQQNALGAFLFQSGYVVMGLVQLLLVFESKKSSMRMRSLKERCPKAFQLVREYLCGEGFHIPPPPVTAHDQWRVLMQKLKFDWIRDSKTIIFTELSKFWKKSHTQFEQFAHFLFYRDDVPPARTKNMITHAQKPLLVSVLSGDMDAVVMLSELGFFVPPDYYWSFPFFRDALQDEKAYGVLRHLCVYYYQRQSERPDVFNPISPPSERRQSPEFKPSTALEAALVGAQPL